MIVRANNRGLLLALWAAYLIVGVLTRKESSSDSCEEEKHAGSSLWRSWFPPSHAGEERPAGGKASMEEAARAKVGGAVDRGKDVLEGASSKVQESAKDAKEAVSSSMDRDGGDWRERTMETLSEATPDWMSREKVNDLFSRERANDLFSRLSNALSPDYHQFGSEGKAGPLSRIMQGSPKSDLFSAKATPEQYRISVNVAGISPRNLNVTLSEDHMLTVRGKSSADGEEAHTVDHAVQLPNDADEPRIQATLRHHILSICIPRLSGPLEKGAPKKIAVIRQAD